jgi:MFS family permease
MCYGGGFGTMPAFAADYFGSKNVGPIYGLMLTAWGFASAFGPLLIAHICGRAADRMQRPPCDCRHHGRIGAAAHPGLAAQGCYIPVRFLAPLKTTLEVRTSMKSESILARS